MYAAIGQQYAFLFMAVGGLLIGCVIHVFFALERAMKAGKVLTALTDAVCVILITALLAFCMLVSVRLEFRLYVLVSALIGIALYFQILYPAAESIVYFVRNIFGRLWKSYNLKKIFRFLFK